MKHSETMFLHCRSEFLNQYLSVGVGSTIFMKAKRSLTNSFDNLMKRKGSRDDFGLGPQLRDMNHLSTGIQKYGSQSPDNSRQSSILDISPESSRPRSLRVSPEQQIVNNGPKSSMMDMLVQFYYISKICGHFLNYIVYFISLFYFSQLFKSW